MRRRAALVALALCVAGLPAIGVGLGAQPAGAAGGTRQISAGGTGRLVSPAFGSGAVQFPEFSAQESEEEPTPGVGPDVDRANSGGNGTGGSANSARKAKSNPELIASFDGLNHRDQRLANGGNQFSVEPPDQGLCAGNGFVMETVNDVIRVFDTAGQPQTGVIDQNSFYGYPPAINRTTLVRGPFVTDPSCLFDTDTQRWFHVVLTLETVPATGAFTGVNHLDIAVSNTSSPLGTWTIYRLPVQDDGTQGTPNHQCSLGPCIGDYPHIGADSTGFYISTNEYSFFGPEFKAAQIYAFSKAALASGAASVGVTQIDTTGMGAGGNPGFTVWPSTSPPGQASSANGGTEFFMSSDAAEEANGNNSSTNLLVWKLANTSSVATSAPNLSITQTTLTVAQYGVPPKSVQPGSGTQLGDFPQGQCLNIPECATAILLGVPDPFTEVVSELDSNDSRMQQTWYANGKLWGALDTQVTVGGESRAGIAWFIVDPSVPKLVKSGTLAMANNNLSYPAIATTAAGRGVMAFTLVGEDHFASAAYASIDAKVGVGDIHIAGAGLGLDDGFTSYKAQVGDPPRTRWGDYGAAALDGKNIWIASEYIGQSCTLTQWLAAPIGSCGGTRTALANWGTRLTKLNV